MAKLDSGARFDAGVRFDQPSPVANPKQTKRTMNPFKLDLTKKSVPEKITLATAHDAAMTGNAFFPDAAHLPADAGFQATLNSLIAGEADVTAKKTAWKASIAARNALESALDAALIARANYCAAAQGDNPEALATTALPLKGAPAPVGALPAPGNLEATFGDNAGEVDLSWDRLYGALSYETQCKEHTDGTPWQPAKTVAQSKATITGLTSGKVYAFRVRAIGPDGPGPWSDESVKMAP